MQLNKSLTQAESCHFRYFTFPGKMEIRLTLQKVTLPGEKFKFYTDSKYPVCFNMTFASYSVSY